MTQDETLSLGLLVEQANAQLQATDVADPDLSASWIVAEAAGLTPAELILEAKSPATQRTVAQVDAMTARRAAGEPLQYVLGRWGFRGLDLAVDKRALIPRPETECLAGAVVDWLKNEAFARRTNGATGSMAGGATGSATGSVPDSAPDPAANATPVSLLVADLGTGSGAIALSIAQEVPEANVLATDLSSEALELARENLAGLGEAGARVTLLQGDWFEPLAPALHECLDAAVSNPPYVTTSEALPPEIDEWEPQAALRSGQDGLTDLHCLIAQAREYLVPGGLLALECSPTQATSLATKLSANGYENVRVTDDLAGKARVLTAQRPLNDIAAERLANARQALRSGGFVVAPTDTVCGALGEYANAEVVRSVYAAKGRPETMALPVLVSGIEQAERLVVLNDEALHLAERHWPGALTLVAPRRGGPDPVGGHTTLGVRVPDLGWLRWLAEQIGPLTGTSANCHGDNTPPQADTAAAALLVHPAYVLDGEAPLAEPSTVVDVCKHEPVVLREGAIKTADLL